MFSLADQMFFFEKAGTTVCDVISLLAGKLGEVEQGELPGS